MNIFYLNNDPRICAEEHCDKHVVKMIIEYAQLMSTAHRMLDGTEYEGRTANGRRIRRWKMNTDYMEDKLYKASHVNHPSAIWTRQNRENYMWLHAMWVQLCMEYTIRYGKTHETFNKLATTLSFPPVNIPEGEFFEPPQAMPESCKRPSAIEGYKKYYITEKKHFAKWKIKTPKWFSEEQYAII
jgi:hypothetical protein